MSLVLRSRLLEFTSNAVPPCFNNSSSPSSLALSITSCEAPWKSAQGVNKTVASGKLLSDQPPDRQLISVEQNQWRRNSHVRSTLLASISHSVALVKERVAMDSWVDSLLNCTLFNSKQNTYCWKDQSFDSPS